MNPTIRPTVAAFCLFIGLISAFFISCSDSSPSPYTENPTSGVVSGQPRPDSLVMRFRLIPGEAVAYATTYLLLPEKVTYGQMNADSLILTVLAGPVNRDDWFLAHSGPDKLLEAGFRRLPDTVAYRLHPINGFVGPDQYPFELCVVRCLSCLDSQEPEIHYQEGQVIR